MLERLLETFFSKVGKQLVDYAHNTVKSIKDFQSTLDSLQRNLKSLSSNASDVEEQIKNAELSGRKKRKREVENWLTEVLIIENEFLKLENEVQSRGFISRFFGGDRAVKLNQRVDELVEQSRHFGELLLDVYETRGEALLTTRLVGEAIEKNLERIWKFLVTDKVSSIGIYGMGGVGKTTLTKHIHNRLLEKTQERVFWVTISQECTIMMFQDKIAHVLGLNLSDEDDEDKRAARLNRALSLRKNIVLILDDLWKNISLEKVGDPLRAEGCRLIITTRSLEVCHQIGCQEIIKVKTLYTDEAWNLFRGTLGRGMTLPLEVQEIAKSMAKVCDGLPLGIITVAGSMRGETAIHVWRNALVKLQKSVMGQDDMEDQVFKVLRYSFDQLNPNHQIQGKNNEYTELQLCFLHCSLYPKDYPISREELVRKFISEELMDKRKSMKAQLDQGHSILDKLVNVCLLESLQYDYVKMHDLVRAMALKITKGKTMVVSGYHSFKEIPNEEDWTKDLEKMSLMHNFIEEFPPGMSPNCPKLSTLLLQSNLYLKFLPDSFFSQMHGLCTLNLSGTAITELPNSLSDLESLKALFLRGCRKLVYVPYMGKLKALGGLDLSGTAILEVPQGMENLVNLKCLSINASYLQMFPTGLLLKFPYLQCLNFPCQIEVPLEEIERLKQLEEFSGRVKDVGDFNWFIGTKQNRVYDTFYSIQVGLTYNGFFSKCYNQLILHRYDLKKGEEKDVTMLAHDTQHLIFHHCEGLNNCLLDDFPRLNNPRSLKTLKVSNCEGIECILTNEQLMAPQELESRFQILEEIVLIDLSDFMGVIHKMEIRGVVQASPPLAVFYSLRQLSISHCNKMRKLGLPVSEFPNLECISVQCCFAIEEIITVADEDGRGEGEAHVVSLPKLKEMHLCWLPRLKSICKATMICNSIQTIGLKGCPTLNKLPLYFPACTTDLHGQPYSYSPPPALTEIRILQREKGWWESLEWEHPTHYHLLQPFLLCFWS